MCHYWKRLPQTKVAQGVTIGRGYHRPRCSQCDYWMRLSQTKVAQGVTIGRGYHRPRYVCWRLPQTKVWLLEATTDQYMIVGGYHRPRCEYWRRLPQTKIWLLLLEATSNQSIPIVYHRPGHTCRLPQTKVAQVVTVVRGYHRPRYTLLYHRPRYDCCKRLPQTKVWLTVGTKDQGMTRYHRPRCD